MGEQKIPNFSYSIKLAITKPDLKFTNIFFPAQNATVLAFREFFYNYLEHVLRLISVSFQSCSIPAHSVHFMS